MTRVKWIREAAGKYKQEVKMQITEHIHALRVPFQVPVSPEMKVDRFVYAYLVYGARVCLIDTGVAGSEAMIFD